MHLPLNARSKYGHVQWSCVRKVLCSECPSSGSAKVGQVAVIGEDAAGESCLRVENENDAGSCRDPEVDVPIKATGDLEGEHGRTVEMGTLDVHLAVDVGELPTHRGRHGGEPFPKGTKSTLRAAERHTVGDCFSDPPLVEHLDRRALIHAGLFSANHRSGGVVRLRSRGLSRNHWAIRRISAASSGRNPAGPMSSSANVLSI